MVYGRFLTFSDAVFPHVSSELKQVGCTDVHNDSVRIERGDEICSNCLWFPISITQFLRRMVRSVSHRVCYLRSCRPDQAKQTGNMNLSKVQLTIFPGPSRGITAVMSLAFCSLGGATKRRPRLGLLRLLKLYWDHLVG